MRPEVSIIVVCYNQQDYIDECLESCVAQLETCASLEIIVADDGSSDLTPAIVQRWADAHPGLIRPVLSPQNTGIAANFNRGLDAAVGEFIAWLGGDDVMLPEKIRAQVACLRKHASASGCYHDAEVFEWPSGKTLGLFSQLYGGRAFTADHVGTVQMIDPRVQMLPSAVMIRRDAVVRKFDERLRFHNDYLFDFEIIARSGHYQRLEGTYVRYRKHAASIGKDKSIRESMLEENLIVLAIMKARYPHLTRNLRRKENYYVALESLKCLNDGDKKRSLKLQKSLFWNGAMTRAIVIFLFGSLLARFAQPRYRSFAMRLRSLFA